MLKFESKILKRFSANYEKRFEYLFKEKREMKTCPNCQARYDDYMRFCLQDGTPLIGGDAEPPTEAATEIYDLPRDTNPQQTEAVTEEWREQNLSEKTIAAGQKPFAATDQFAAPPTQIESEPPRKSGAGIFFGAVFVGGLLLIGGAIGGVFWVLSNQNSNEIASSNTNTANAANSNISKENPNFEVSNANISDAANLPFANSNENIKSTPAPKPTTTPKPDETKTPDKTPTPENKPTPKPTVDNEPTPKPIPKRPVSGGVLNGKATSLPKPAYPPAARAVRASGAVNVQVLVDENGNVTQASAVSGHPLLRNSAVQAARGAKFRPMQLSGQAVRFTGIIVYNFVP